MAKHASARRVEICLKKEKSFIEMLIADNGQGFDPNLIISGHYGVSIMRERADGVGAQILITSQPGIGAEVRLIWMEPLTTDTL